MALFFWLQNFKNIKSDLKFSWLKPGTITSQDPFGPVIREDKNYGESLPLLYASGKENNSEHSESDQITSEISKDASDFEWNTIWSYEDFTFHGDEKPFEQDAKDPIVPPELDAAKTLLTQVAEMDEVSLLTVDAEESQEYSIPRDGPHEIESRNAKDFPWKAASESDILGHSLCQDVELELCDLGDEIHAERRNACGCRYSKPKNYSLTHFSRYSDPEDSSLTVRMFHVNPLWTKFFFSSFFRT